MTEPISLAEAKANMRVVSSDEDADITGMIVAARAAIERYTGLVLTARTVIETSDAYGPYGVELRAWPIRSITSVAYIDPAGATQVLASTGYSIATARRPVRIGAPLGGWLPGLAAIDGAVTVTAEAGFETPDDVPGDIKRALLATVACFYEDRSASEVPPQVRRALGPYRLRRV